MIRGETSHYDIVAGESARGLMELAVQRGALIGNGILTTDDGRQARVRADPGGKDKGGDAARAALALLQIKAVLAADDAPARAPASAPSRRSTRSS